MNQQRLVCILIFVCATSTATRHSSEYREIERRRQSHNKGNGGSRMATISDSMDDYDTFDGERFGESQVGVEDREEAAKERVETPSRQQLETHINYNTVPGTPGVDYPNHAYVPLTTFYCYNHRHPGYYADVEAGCQVFHVCDVDGRQDSFLCPKGTIFNQAYFICDWWFNVDCGQAPNYYGNNGDLHKTPSHATYSDAAA